MELKIAAEGWGCDQQNNWVEGINGSNAVMLTNPSTQRDCWDDTPSFNSTGTKIVFSRDAYNSTTQTEAEDIYIMNADGTGTPTKLTDSIGYNSDPLVLRDPASNTDKILFVSNRGNLNAGTDGYDLYSISLDGTSLTRLTNNMLFDAFSLEYYDVDSVAAARRTRPRAAIQSRPWKLGSNNPLNW